MNNITHTDTQLVQYSNELFDGITQLIRNSQTRVAVSLNTETTLLYWNIGNYINKNLKSSGRLDYGKKIVATLSQQLTHSFGKGYTYTALTRMCKVALVFDEQNIATLSQQLSWSHLIELAAIDDTTKRDFYTQLCVYEKWGVRLLRDKTDQMLFERTAIASKPEKIIQSSLKNLKENKEINPELIFKNSYVLNYHRKLKRLVAIDLKLGKFKPRHKAQIELYLRWLQKHEMQQGEENPIGLLLCSEGNTEHIEFLMLDEKEIKVAQCLTELPSKKWFADKLHRAMEIVKQNAINNE